MLSILIPTYNYYIYDLVLNIHKKCLKENIVFEIICLDDNSDSNFTEANKKIEALSNCFYKISRENKGRIATREHLAKLAKNKWLLFLDADVLPKNGHFINKYVNYTNQDYLAIFGGLFYEEKNSNKQLLRWKYGKQNEEVPAVKRNLKPYKVVTSANLFIKKDIYLFFSKQFKTNTYGGDLIFAILLKEQNTNILHIDNEVIHLGLESNITYLLKVEKAIYNLLTLYNENKIKTHQNDLLKAYLILKKLRLRFLFSYAFKIFNKTIKNNLTGNAPSIKLLQLYKICYMCNLSLN
ncbi:glycosyltransferase [Mesoflavibacter sp. CH_XMU1404-2]|uniref:glycosyltransferase n=1 Tax=Mesoflavibacter sp. CH_XMU1404-2 TaxID=3107766 RepID=UPI00243A8902|tara:strand:- start:1262 stop:2146 length:885 start_codon:yes stop_codon:yes gene_type:complete